nr:hypothetical protein [Providencia rettgeri]ELR5222172.1 hypothetical protein [Providencia rettgeri]
MLFDWVSNLQKHIKNKVKY